jgi:AraC-like DNA-binding protein
MPVRLEIARVQNGVMRRPATRVASVPRIRELARSGQLRPAGQAAQAALAALGARAAPRMRVELHLVAAFCAMRQGNHADAHRELDAAADASSAPGAQAGLALRVETWRAELAYFEGRYSAANEAIDLLVDRLEKGGDPGYAAFALRIRMAILLARADYEGVAAFASRSLRLARASRDDYVIVQILNILGAVCFDRATSKLQQQQHVRAHLPALDATDTAAMQGDAREALSLFEKARKVAERAKYHFAAWYVAGNIERLEILLGRADRAVPAIRKRLRVLQARGAKYDEIVTRSNLAWALRTLGRHRDALHELDVALDLARDTSTFNVLLEFIHYDRSVVLDALGDSAGAHAAYRRYLRLAGPWNGHAAPSAGSVLAAAPKRPLEPFFLKRADRYVVEHLGQPLAIERLAQHCGVSWKTLQKAFGDFRGLTPVAHVRNMRLDAARRALDAGDVTVAEVAARFGFRSTTTFSLEYRKRFSVPPSRTKRRAAALATA